MQDDPYANPTLYDLEYADHNEDIQYYVSLARNSGGRVLELGCGTGRLTLPIARAGVQIDGIDLAEGMLEGLRLKVGAEPAPIANRIRFFPGDFREPPAHLRTDYAAVIWPFNALHHCRDGEDVRRTLEAAKARMRPGALLAFDLYLPDRELYDRDPDQTYEHRIFSDPRTGQPLHTWERGWWDEPTKIHHVVYTYKSSTGTAEHCHLKLRMFERKEILALLEHAELEIVDSYEDFSGAPLKRHSLKWVVTCRCRA